MIPSGVQRVFHHTLGVDPHALTLSSGQESVENWDSLTHIELVIALEREFEVQFTTTDFGRMLTVGEIIAVLREKGRA